MTQIHLHSEPYSRDGNIAADGAIRLLGQPSLTPLELVIRETVQNSWDASLDRPGTPRYTVRVRLLDEHQREAMREFFSELPPADAHEPLTPLLGRFLSSSAPAVLEICDECTTGLDGPTSASSSLQEGESANFVNFVRNIGSARDLALGGGTYGFGKSSLFKISRCSTILIHTLTEVHGLLEHRLIGNALGSHYDHGGRRYTGRHWWGSRVEQESGSVDPLLGAEAAGLAARLGFLERQTDAHRGTSLLILDPDLEDLTEGACSASAPSNEARNRLRARLQDLILWHCWPKFTRWLDDSVPMECHLSILGDESRLPDPSTIQPLWLMTQALQKARQREEQVNILRPRALLGHFGHCTASIELEADQRFRTYLGDEALIPEKLHHAALLRPAELVVRYEEGTLNEADRLQWAGVFISDIGENAEVEQAFAMSEPPAHDDWQPKSAQSLTPRQRSFVTVALKRIRERVRELSGADLQRQKPSPVASGQSLAKLAGDLGRSLIGAGPGGSDGGRRGGGVGGGGRRPLRLSRPEPLGTTLRDGEPVSAFRLRLTGETAADPCITFTPWVQMDEGVKDSMAPNGRAPRVIGVEIDSRPVEFSETGIPCPVGPNGSTILVHVSIPDYVAVGVTAEILPGTDP